MILTFMVKHENQDIISRNWTQHNICRLCCLGGINIILFKTNIRKACNFFLYLIFEKEWLFQWDKNQLFLLINYFKGFIYFTQRTKINQCVCFRRQQIIHLGFKMHNINYNWNVLWVCIEIFYFRNT